MNTHIKHSKIVFGQLNNGLMAIVLFSYELIQHANLNIEFELFKGSDLGQGAKEQKYILLKHNSDFSAANLLLLQTHSRLQCSWASNHVITSGLVFIMPNILVTLTHFGGNMNLLLEQKKIKIKIHLNNLQHHFKCQLQLCSSKEFILLH